MEQALLIFLTFVVGSVSIAIAGVILFYVITFILAIIVCIGELLLIWAKNIWGFIVTPTKKKKPKTKVHHDNIITTYSDIMHLEKNVEMVLSNCVIDVGNCGPMSRRSAEKIVAELLNLKNVTFENCVFLVNCANKIHKFNCR